MKLVPFNLFLDAPPPTPKMPITYNVNVYSDMFLFSSSEVYTLVFYLAIVNNALRHCHSWLARQFH